MKGNGALVLALLLLGLQGCASFELEQADEAREDDEQVTAQMAVKTALLKADDIAAAPIRVEYEEGLLHLRGFVETEAERERVGQVAEQALPEVEIVNEVAVWGAADETLENVSGVATGVTEDQES